MPGAFEELRAEMVLDADGVSSGVSEAERSLGGLKTAVGGLGVAAGAAAAGGLAAAVSSAADFEQQMVELEKVTDPKTAEEMGSAIKDMAGEMPLAQSELAGIAEQAGRLGIEGTDNIRNFTRVTGEMATATDLTADQAAENFARMTTLLNEPVENVRTLGDSVNALSNTMATSSSEITDAVKRSGASLTNMGMASEDILALNAAMNESSESAERAGTRLRRMSQELMSPKKVGDLSSALGMTADEFKNMRSNDPTGLIQTMAQRMNEGGESAEALRGTLSTTSRQALAGLSNNLDGMNQALDTSSEQFKEGGSLASEFETAMGTFKNQVQLARNTLNNIAITIGNVLLPYLTTLMKYVTGALQRFQSFNEATDGVAATIGLITTAITGLVGGGALLLSQFGYLGPAITGVKVAFSALLGPVGLVAAAVVGLAAVFSGRLPEIVSITNTAVDKFQAALGRAVTWLRTTAPSLIRSAISQLVANAEESWATIQDRIIPGLRSAVQSAMAWLRSTGVPMARQGFQTLVERASVAFDTLTEDLPPKLAAAFNAAVAWIHSTGIPMAQQAFRTLATQALTALEFTRENIVPKVRSGLNTAWNWIRTEGVALAMGALSFLSTQALGALEFTREKVVPPVRAGLATAWTWVRTEGVALAKQALSFLSTQALAALAFTRENIVPKVRAGLGQAWTWVRTEGVALAKSAFGQLVTLTMNAVDFWNGAIQPRLVSAFDSAKTWIMGPALERFKAAFRTLGANWYPMVLDTLGLILKAFQTVIPMVTSWISENGPGLINKAFYAIGRGIRTTILGMFAVAGLVGSAVVSAITGIRDWLQSGGKERLKNGFINIITGIASYLRNDAWDDLKAAAIYMFDAIMAAAKGLYQGLIGGSLIPEMFSEIASYIRTTARTAITNAVTSIKDGAMGIFDTFRSDVMTWGGNVADDIEQAFLDAKSYAETVVGNMKDSVVDLIGGIGGAGADALKDAFNAAIPSSVGIDPVRIAGKEVFGGASIDLPSLDTGGVIEDDGIYVGHAGERVLNPAETKQYNRGGGDGGDNVEIHLDFGDLSDDDYVSVGAMKAMIKEEIRDDNDRKIRRGST